MAEKIPGDGARPEAGIEAQSLTADEISSLNRVGELMCTDMINAAATADMLTDMGMESMIDPAQRVTHDTTSAWVAIAEEYAEALDAIEAGTF